MELETLGLKRVEALYEQLDINDLDHPRQAVRNGEIRKLKGFGVKSEQKIRQELERYHGKSREPDWSSDGTDR